MAAPKNTGQPISICFEYVFENLKNLTVCLLDAKLNQGEISDPRLHTPAVEILKPKTEIWTHEHRQSAPSAPRKGKIHHRWWS